MKIIQPSKLSKKGQARSSRAVNADSDRSAHRYRKRAEESSDLDIFDDDNSWLDRKEFRLTPNKAKHSTPANKTESGRVSRSNKAVTNTASNHVRLNKQGNSFQEPEFEEAPPLAPGKKRRRSELSCSESEVVLEFATDPTKKEFNEILARGVRLLAMREHSVKEIIDKLSAKTESSEQVYAVIDELLENKYLSDERFTESYVRSRMNRGYGPIKIRSELKTKGIGNNLIQDYLNPNASIWFDNALSQYHKKYGDSPLSDYNTWTKRARFMQSRGFTLEHIQVTLPRIEFD